MNLILKPNARPRLPLLALAAMMACSVPAAAQEVVAPATPNADRLAEEMRVLARDPRNVRALLSAGEASARLNDPSAAAGFFARAQALDPRNPRVQAGQAMVMVRMERPGEALRLFDAAARAGLNMDAYASDRGLAYDLIGAQGHAQRDHRVAMRNNPDDETRRRYALSLGISGDTSQAMTVLDPLLKRSDRAAWRARAFIMAMTGDAVGADKIAASMMGGFGTALSPFFRRLPALSAPDKAFAVHFGEIRRTPARIADANLAPPLPTLRGEPGVALAAAQPARVPQPAPSTGRRNEAARSAPTERRVSRREERAARSLAERQSLQREAQRVAEAKAQQERDALAARQREAEQLVARQAEARRVAELQASERQAAEAARLAEAQRLADAERLAQVQRLAEADRAAEAARVAQAQRVVQASTPMALPNTLPAAPTVASSAPSSPAPADVAASTASVADTPALTDAAPVVIATATAPSAVPSIETATPPRVGREDGVIARIIAGITIPASELGVEPMPGERLAAAPSAVPTPAPVEVARATPITSPPVKATPAPTPVKAPPTREVAKAADTKSKVAETKAAAAKAKAAEEKAAAAKAKAKPDPAKSEPARTWVQVAGGANVSDLPKTYGALVAKAPAEFRGKQAWTTPLRFTNRLLVGPFKSGAEAQTFVNAIGKKGVSAFAWTSEAGQKIAKLAAK